MAKSVEVRGWTNVPSLSDVALSITLDPTTPTSGSVIQEGDEVVAVLIANAAASNNFSPPAGWSEVQPTWGLIGTFLTKVYRKKWAAGDSIPTFTMSGTARWLQGTIFWIKDAEGPVIGIPKNRSAAPTENLTTTVPSVDITDVPTLVVALAFERTTAAESTPISVSGATMLYVVDQPNTNSISTIAVATKLQTVAGLSGSVVFTYPNGQATNGWGFQLGFEQSEDVDPEEPPAHPIEAFWANTPFYVAHRCGGAHWPELTMYGLKQCLSWGAKAIELSVWKTSDNIWVCHHDYNTSRMTGVSHNISEVTWATLKDLTITAEATDKPGQARRPIMRMLEAIDAIPSDVIVYIDDKTTMNISALLDILDTYENSTERFVIKQFKGSWAQADVARARGYKTWGIYYDAEIVTEPTRTGSFDSIGLNFNASTEHWNAAKALGKPLAGHIITNATQGSTALWKGATGLMVSSVKTAMPNNPRMVTFAKGIDRLYTTGSTRVKGVLSAAITAIK